MCFEAKTALLKQKTALLKQLALLKQKALSYPDTSAASAVCIYYVIIGGRFAPPYKYMIKYIQQKQQKYLDKTRLFALIKSFALIKQPLL